MTEIHVAASRGNPYTVTRDDRGLVRLKRKTAAGQTVTIVFGAADVVAVCNAMADLVEGDE